MSNAENSTEPPDPGPSEALPLNSTTAARLRSAIGRRAVCKRLCWLLKAVGIVVLVLTTLALALSGPAYGSLGLPLLLTVCAVLAVGALSYASLRAVGVKSADYIGRCTRRLNEVQSAAEMPTLLMFQRSEAEDVQEIIARRMTDIIDRIEPGEDGCLPHAEWRKLLNNIEAHWIADRSDLGVAIIRMFQRTRHARSIEVVRRYAKPGAWLLAGETVRSAARESLPILEAAVDEMKQRETLLRASGPGSNLAEELLRGAGPGRPAADPDSLLRPIFEENQGTHPA